MHFVFFFFLLVISIVNGIKPYPPVTRHAYPPHGVRQMALTRSMWIIMIKQGEPQLNVIEQGLNSRLLSDGCYLLNSDNGLNRLLMEIYCDRETSDDDDVIIATPETTIPFTRTLDYLLLYYSRSNILIEASVVVRYPTFWYDDYSSSGGGGGASRFAVSGGGGGNKDEIGVKSIQDFFNDIHENDLYRKKEKTPPLNKMIFHADFLQPDVTWGLDRIDQRNGVRDGRYTYNSFAENIDVYIVDTGINVNHLEFNGRAIFHYNSIDNINDDCQGHGTHVAGIVGSQSYGVAKNVSLIAIKVLDCTGTGTTFNIVAGLNAAVNRIIQTGKRSVINLSLGGDKSSILDSVIQDIALNYNVVIVVAAGNDADNACNYSPSGLGQSNTILVVSASDYNDMKPLWANKGECVDVSAPGLSILSTWKGSLTAVASLSGTSMATPFVVGVVALVLQQRPTMTVAETCALITTSATPNVIVAATSDGGGKNLLYSLVDPNVIESTPSPPSPTPLPTTSNPTVSSGSNSRLSIAPLFMIFSIVYLFYLC
jgi:subtilisin family serine protease